jgi:hypothetical protein
MILHQQPADLDDTTAVIADAEMHSIGRTILRQVRTFAGIAEIAALSELVVRRRRTFMPRGRASAGETITERKPATMRPEFRVTANRRKEIWTGQEPSQSR